MSPRLRKLFDREDNGKESHVYEIGKKLLQDPLTPLIQKIELVKILLPFRLPKLLDQTIDVHTDRPAPVQRLTILNLLAADMVDGKTKNQLREFFLEEQ